jgi:membrane-associated phospholipid phosphatase
MKRAAVFASVLFTVLALSSTSLARQLKGHRPEAHTSLAQPDQVIEWNQEMLQLLQAPGAQPATIHPTRTMAIAQLAVYDAVNAIERQGEPYLFHERASREASPDAAAASAARTSLLALLPSQQPAIDAFYQQSLAQIGFGWRVQAGMEVGQEAADTILAARQDDGSAVAPPLFTPGIGPGEYQFTPPKFVQPVFTQWPAVRPFALESGSQFRPGPPPAVSGARYATDFNEVKSWGRVNSSTRTADQTAIGQFWSAAPVQNVWNQIAQMAGIASHNTLAQNARMFALVDTSLADSVIALYDAKYAYHRWRPVTAIQAADTGNPNALGDPTWTPLTATATDPSYPGAHADISSAAATALADFFGSDQFTFSLTNPTLPGIVRSFQSFSAAAEEASNSRIYAGQHFRYDEDAGQTLGQQVGDFVAHTVLQARPDEGRDGDRDQGHHERRSWARPAA